MNLEKNNSDLQDALENNTSEVYVEDESGEAVSLIELKKNEDVETAFQLSLKLWDIEDNEGDKGDLKTAVEIAMNKTDGLIKNVVFLNPEKQDKLKTAADIAIERADKLIAEEEKEINDEESGIEIVDKEESDEENDIFDRINSDIEKVNIEFDYLISKTEDSKEKESLEKTRTEKLTVLNNELEKEVKVYRNNENPLEEKEIDVEAGNSIKNNTETPEEVEKDISLEIDEIANKESNPTKDSGFALRTFKKWKNTFEKYSQNKKNERAGIKMDSLKEEFESNSEDILKLNLSIREIEDKFTKAISEATDKKIINLLEKNKQEQINKVEQEKLEKSAEMDGIRSEYWDLDTELSETTEKINKIQSEYSEKIDSKIQEVLEDGQYYESLDHLEFHSSKLKKFIKAFNNAEKLRNSIKEILKSDDLISKEDRKELNKRAWNLKKRMAVYYQVIMKFSKDKRNEKKHIQSIKKTVSKLISLKK